MTKQIKSNGLFSRLLYSGYGLISGSPHLGPSLNGPARSKTALISPENTGINSSSNSPNKPIRAVDSWVKNGKVVVELGAFANDDTSFMPRLCVVGGGTIQIVSVLENGAWR